MSEVKGETGGSARRLNTSEGRPTSMAPYSVGFVV
jgi:hypothetical protein